MSKNLPATKNRTGLLSILRRRQRPVEQAPVLTPVVVPTADELNEAEDMLGIRIPRTAGAVALGFSRETMAPTDAA